MLSEMVLPCEVMCSMENEMFTDPFSCVHDISVLSFIMHCSVLRGFHMWRETVTYFSAFTLSSLSVSLFRSSLSLPLHDSSAGNKSAIQSRFLS